MSETYFAADVYGAWSAATQDCMVATATVWLAATQPSLDLQAAPSRLDGAAPIALRGAVDPQVECVDVADETPRSWYRPPSWIEADRATPAFGWAAMTPSGWPAMVGQSPAVAPWPNLYAGMMFWLQPTPAMFPSQAMAPIAFPFASASNPWAGTWLEPWASAWMEGVSRAMLVEPMASAAEAMRHPNSGIPFVSYRSDSGFAVSQIACTATKMMAAAAPASNMLMATWMAPFLAAFATRSR